MYDSKMTQSKPKDVNDKSLYEKLIQRDDLQEFKPNRIAMLALELRYNLDDLRTVADDALTDDKLDHKCDLLYIDRDSGTAIIAQAFEAESLDKSEPKINKAADLNTALAWILDGEVPDDKLGIKLKSAAADLRNSLQSGEISMVEVWFIHNLPESTAVDGELRQVENTAVGLIKHYLPDADMPEVRALQVSRTRIASWYRNQNTAILVSESFQVPGNGSWFREEGEDWRAICTSIPASWLRDLHLEYGDELFSANVRGPIPSRRSKNNINYTIGKTAKEQPERFWAYNNGITALAHNFEADEKTRTLRINGIAIVNGAQTTGSISRAQGADLDNVKILARFVESSDPEVIDNIIRYNNSQNPIKPADFRGRDSHQARLRDEFNKIPDVKYLGPRRGGADDTPKKPSNFISSDTAAQALAAFHGDAGLAYHDLKLIWDKDDNYLKYFGDHTSATHIIFCWSLLRCVQKYKTELINRETMLSATDRETLTFLRKRGATFLLVAAIGGALDTLLNSAVANSYRLSFGPETSPSEAVEHWQPVVAALGSLAPDLAEGESGAAFQRGTNLSARIAAFRRYVGAVRVGLSPVVEALDKYIKEDPQPAPAQQ